MSAMYVEHVSRPSAFSRLDVRVKLFIVFLVSTLIFVWANVVYLAVMFLALLLVALASHIDPRYIRRLLLIMGPFLVILLLVHGLFNIVGRTALLTAPEWVPVLGGVSLYWEGLVFGFAVFLRLLCPLLVMPLVVMTTDVNDLILGLVRLRVPYKVAFIFAVVLRFVPFLLGEIGAITEAQRLRGLALEKMGFFRRIPVFATLAVPLILGSLLKAQTLEVVLQSKAFSGSPDRTFVHDIRMRPTDYAVLFSGILLLILAVFARLYWGWGSFVA